MCGSRCGKRYSLLSFSRANCTVLLKGVCASEESIVLAPEPITGPNLELEGRLFRFYVLINGKVVVPCLARLHHTTCVESKQVIAVGVDFSKATEADQRQAGINPDEQLFVSKTPLNPQEVFAMMQQRPADAKNLLEELATSLTLFSDEDLPEKRPAVKAPKWGWGRKEARKFL